MAFCQHLCQFFADSFVADLSNLRRQTPQGSKRFVLDAITESRGEAHCPQHPQLVFAKPLRRITDSTNNFGFEVCASANMIDRPISIERIHHQSVDREISPLNVVLRIKAESHGVGMTTIRVKTVSWERRNFNSVRMRTAIALGLRDHVHAERFRRSR